MSATSGDDAPGQGPLAADRPSIYFLGDDKISVGQNGLKIEYTC